MASSRTFRQAKTTTELPSAQWQTEPVCLRRAARHFEIRSALLPNPEAVHFTVRVAFLLITLPARLLIVTAKTAPLSVSVFGGVT